jgi:hypothetical protein
VQTRVRELPSRVVVCLLLTGCLFAEVGCCGVWAKLTPGLAGLSVCCPGPSALSQARQRVGPARRRRATRSDLIGSQRRYSVTYTDLGGSDATAATTVP